MTSERTEPGGQRRERGRGRRYGRWKGIGGEGLVQEGEGAAVDFIDQHLTPPSGPLVEGGGMPCQVVGIEIAQDQCVVRAGEQGGEGSLEGMARGAAGNWGDVDVINVKGGAIDGGPDA